MIDCMTCIGNTKVWGLIEGQQWHQVINGNCMGVLVFPWEIRFRSLGIQRFRKYSSRDIKFRALYLVAGDTFTKSYSYFWYYKILQYIITRWWVTRKKGSKADILIPKWDEPLFITCKCTFIYIILQWDWYTIS
jgi:hypothetical protein